MRTLSLLTVLIFASASWPAASAAECQMAASARSKHCACKASQQQGPQYQRACCCHVEQPVGTSVPVPASAATEKPAQTCVPLVASLPIGFAVPPGVTRPGPVRGAGPPPTRCLLHQTQRYRP